MKNINTTTSQPEYGLAFWNHMRNQPAADYLVNGNSFGITGGYAFPADSHAEYDEKLLEHSVFRNIATVVSVTDTDNKIKTFDSLEEGSWPGNGEFDVEDADSSNTFTITAHRCGIVLKFAKDFICDAQFDIRTHLLKTLAKRMASVEDYGFISGSGTNTPTGILASSGGAQTGASTSSLTYDDVISLYFSLDLEYRKNGSWLVNDNTAMALRKLKDENGRYLWRDNDDTIFGRPVFISEHMPDIGVGKKPIAFGDFTYYWVIQRAPMSIKPLIELYALSQKVGYLCLERLDGRLLRTDAVKVLSITQ